MSLPDLPAPTTMTPPTATSRRAVIAWGLWDWGSASINAVATSFVFTVYLTGSAFGDAATTSQALSLALTLAGLVVLITAPITGQRSDASAHRKRWLGINTGVVVLMLALMIFVREDTAYLWFGLTLLAVGTVFYELASVNYNAMLSQISTPRTVGKVSGFGWGMGYLGGIVLLLVLYFGLIKPEVGLFGVTAADGMAVRVSMLLAAIWFAVSALPLLFAVPENTPSTPGAARIGFFASYRVLFGTVASLWRESRTTVWFLLASAIFRDGLTGVFTFVGVLATGTFGLTAADVLIFAIAANVVAGIVTMASGFFDDRFGPKPVMIVSLVALVVGGILIFVLHDGGPAVFWGLGLAMAMFVGPAQSASRTFLARSIPTGREGEVFGLYATTGRAAVFLAPMMFGVFVTLGGHQYWGVLGLVAVLLVGLALLLPVRSPAR